LLWVIFVNHKDWDGEDEDTDHQVHERFDDVKEGIDTESEDKEWLINDLGVTLWHLDLHLFK
jgi:hypothetical protein